MREALDQMVSLLDTIVDQYEIMVDSADDTDPSRYNKAMSRQADIQEELFTITDRISADMGLDELFPP